MAKLQNTTFRNARPEDARQIAQLFKTNYLSTYPYPDYFNPHRVEALINEEALICFVALQNDTIIGCACLVKYDAHTFEIGRFLVNSALRNQGIGSGIYRMLTQYIQKQKVHNIYSECVTSNGRSIAVAIKNGLKPFGFAIGIYENYFTENSPRESDCLVILPKPSPTLKNIYANKNTAELIEYVSNHLGARREIVIHEKGPHLSTSDLDYRFDPAQSNAYITIKSVGLDLESQLTDLLKTIPTQICFIKCTLNASDPLATFITTILEKFGFIFMAFWPDYYSNGHFIDQLSMQLVLPCNNCALENLDIPDAFSLALFKKICHQYATITKSVQLYQS
jgi:RimJ/RimL family protein N-acetyltransferase